MRRPIDSSSIDSAAPRRCAVYTRTSVDDERSREFTSIDAQREAGQAYITSQITRGWILVDQNYDDAGYSGRDLHRPAIKRLMADIRHGMIDVVVVYKIDRLSRSMADITQLIALLTQFNVALVSVTQQLDTQTTMGRLTINLLMSFAEFERDLAGDRARDKIVATRRQGGWIGSVPPLGYDVVKQELVVNGKEAAVVKQIFQRYLALDAMTDLIRSLAESGLTTKVWQTAAGKMRGGKPFDKNSLYKILRNRVYCGELFFDGDWHPGKHTPLIDLGLWDQVRTKMAGNTRISREPRTKSAVATFFLLKGLIFGADGRAFSPWTSSAARNRRYRYYIHQRELTEGAGASGMDRLPAAELESAVIQQLLEMWRSPSKLLDLLPPESRGVLNADIDALSARLKRLDEVWERIFPIEQQRIIRQLLERVTLAPARMELSFSPHGLAELLMELKAVN